MAHRTLAASLAASLAACSFMGHDVHHAIAPKDPYCPNVVWPSADAVGTAAFGYLSVVAYLHRDDTDSAAGVFVIPIAAVALAYASAAIYGFAKHAGC